LTLKDYFRSFPHPQTFDLGRHLARGVEDGVPEHVEIEFASEGGNA
jgi:hypothetical protein